MKLNELKEKIDKYAASGKGDYEVSIYLDEPNVGFHAFSSIKNIFEGIDFDRGNVFIAGREELIRKNKDRDIAKPIIKDAVFTKKFICPVCTCQVNKKDDYCSTCGQKLVYIKENKNENQK